MTAPLAAYERLPPWLADASGMRVAVLGADGFIGSSVVRACLAASATVTAICVKTPWRLEGIEAGARLRHVPAGRWWEPAYEPTFAADIQSADAVVLLAYEPPASRSAPEAEPHELGVNAAGTRRLTRAAAAAGSRVVFSSSADVYGPWHQLLVGETTPPEPTTTYARAKLETERLVEQECEDRSVATILRIATVFGPGEDGPRAIPSFFRSLRHSQGVVLHGDGSDVRDYVYVADVAGAIVSACALRTSPDADTVVNIGSGTGRSTADVLEAVAGVLGIDPKVRSAPARPASRLVLDIARARRMLGFEPRSDFEGALGDQARWLADREAARVAELRG